MSDIHPLKLRESFSNTVLDHDFERGPLLLLAGPGTGKTYSLLETIRRGLENGHSLQDFFEATLTNAASEKFRDDVREEISSEFDSSTTLHHRAKGILHRHANMVNIVPGFNVIDANCEELIATDLRGLNGLDDQDFRSSLRFYQKDSAHGISRRDEFSRAYRTLQSFYEVLDWYDVILLACHLLNTNNDIRDIESRSCRFLLIDEYQDLNPAEQLFVELLLNGRGTLLAVGDDDQSIYSGRYADSSGIRHFEERYPNATVLQLPVSSRLPTNVISASTSLITNNEIRRSKEQLISLPDTDERAGNGFVISVNNKSETAERQFIFDAILQLIGMGVPQKEILVLCNCRALGLELVDVISELDREDKILIRNDLEKQHELVAEEYLLLQLRRFITNPDNNLAARFVLNEIAGDHSEEEQEIVSFAINEGLSLWQALATEELNSRIQYLGPVLREFRIRVESLDTEADTNTRLAELVASFQPLSHLQESITLEVEGVQEENEQIVTNTSTGVRFITLHSSKGLDGDFIFIPFMEEAIGIQGLDIEEQRRLLYVALTRAKVGAIISWAWSRKSAKRFKCSGIGGAVTDLTPYNRTIS